MTKFFYSNFLGGANTAVSPFLQSDNTLYVQNGVVTSYKLGAAYKDLGYLRIGNGAVESGKSITGMFHFRQSPSVDKLLVTVNDATDDDTQLWYNNSGTWAEITDAETAWANYANVVVDMESFIGYCFIVGHSSVDGFLPVGSLTGTTFSTSAQVTNMAQGKYVKRYRDRLYVANCRYSSTDYPYRVYFSSVPSAGSITWTPDEDFFDIDYSEQIMGMVANWDQLIIFTKFSAYYYTQDALKQLWAIGTSNHRTIKAYGQYVFFANTDGVWASQNAGNPANISGEVIDFFRNTNSNNWFAELVDEEYHIYVGTATVNGVSYSNVVLTYSIPTASWRWRELYDNMKIFARYHDSTGKNRLYMGDANGLVWDKSKYTDTTLIYSDSQTSSSVVVNPIFSSFETKPFSMDDPESIKRLISVDIYAERAMGVNVKFRALDRNTRAYTEYLPLGTLNKYINSFEGRDLEFNMIQFQFSEYSSNPYYSIFGLMLDVEVLGASTPKN